MAKDYLQYLILTALNIAVSLLLLFGFVTFLNKVAYAEYGVLWTASTLLLLLINLGHKDALFKYTSQNNTTKAASVIGSSLVICFSLTIFFLAFWIVSDNTLTLALCAATGLQIITILATHYRGRGMYARDVSVILLYRWLWLSMFAFLALTLTSVSEISVFWTGIVASIVTFFLMGGRKFFGISEVTFASVKNALSDPIVRGFFIIELVTVSFMKVDVLLLRYFDTNYQHLAEYFFSVQVFEAAILMLMPVTFLFFNRFNQKRDSQSGQSLLKKSALILSIVFSLGLMTWCFLGNFILSNLFPGYSNAFETILILTIALLPNAFNALFSAYLIANHKENIFIWVSVLGLLLLFCINLFAIPAFSIRGAAWARLISEFGIAVILLTYVIAMLRRSKNNY